MSRRHYDSFKTFTDETYEAFLAPRSIKPSQASKMVKIMMDTFLKSICFDKKEIRDFAKALRKKEARMLKVNRKVKAELSKKLGKYTKRMEDLNSVVMGVMTKDDSDLDFTIAVKTRAEQKEVGDKLAGMGFKLTEVREENIPSNIKWFNWTKYVDGVEIEAKVRSEKILKDILVAHRGLANLDRDLKYRISFAKSVLVKGDKKTYQKYKNLLYAMGFNGYARTIVFRV